MPSAGVVVKAAAVAAATGGARNPATATASRPQTSITVSRFWVPAEARRPAMFRSVSATTIAAAQRAPDAGPSETTVDR